MGREIKVACTTGPSTMLPEGLKELEGPRPAGNRRFPVFLAGNRPRDPLRSPGLARNSNFHEKSAPATNSNAISCLGSLWGSSSIGALLGVSGVPVFR